MATVTNAWATPVATKKLIVQYNIVVIISDKTLVTTKLHANNDSCMSDSMVHSPVAAKKWSLNDISTTSRMTALGTARNVNIALSMDGRNLV